MSRRNVNVAGQGQQRGDPQGDEEEENRPQLELEHVRCDDGLPMPPGRQFDEVVHENRIDQMPANPNVNSGSGMGPPLAPSQMAALAEEIVEDDEECRSKKNAAVEAIKENVEDANNSGSGMGPPLAPSQMAALAEEMVENDEEYRSKKKAAVEAIKENVEDANNSGSGESERRATAPATPTPASATSQGASPVINQNRGSSRRRRSRSILPPLPMRGIRPPPPSMRDPPNRAPSEPSESNVPVFHHVEATAVEGVEATLIPEEPARPVYVDAVEVTTVTALPWWKKHQKWVILVLVLIIGALVGTVVVGSQGGGYDRDIEGAQIIDPLLPTSNPTSITGGDAVGAQDIDPLLPTSSPTSITGGSTVTPSAINVFSETAELTELPSLNPISPTYNPIASPTPKPTGLILHGPVSTGNLKLVFHGVESPGDKALFQQNLQNYLAVFYSPDNLNKRFNEDDPFRSLSDVSIEVDIVSYENRRLVRGVLEGANMPSLPNMRGNQRNLQSVPVSKESGPSKFIATYNQITSYRAYPSITIDMIVRRPFDPEYSATLVEYLQRRNPDQFADLRDVEFVEARPLLAGTYAAWKWYDRNGLASPANLRLNKYSRIYYAFFQTDDRGYVFGADSWADPNVLFGPYDFSTRADSLLNECRGGSGQDDGKLGEGMARPCERFEQCHRDFPGSKSCNVHKFEEGLIYAAHTAGTQVYVSIGGWTLSGNYPTVAADADKRARFAEECAGLIADYGFDGIDIDWEYPGYRPHGGSARDRDNFNKLLLVVREAPDDYQTNTGDVPLGGGPFGLTATLPCSPENIDFLDVPFINAVLSGANLMTMDFHNEQDVVTGANSPLYDQEWDDEDGLSVDGCVKNYLETGMEAHKISVGVPFYGKTFSYATELNGFHSNTNGRGSGSADEHNWSLGTPVYYNIAKKLSEGGMVSNRHEPTKTQYAYFTDGSGLVTYDDPQAVCDKANYVNTEKLGGLFAWEVTGSLMENLEMPLVDAINSKLEEPNFDCRSIATSTMSTPQTISNISLPMPPSMSMTPETVAKPTMGVSRALPANSTTATPTLTVPLASPMSSNTTTPSTTAIPTTTATLTTPVNADGDGTPTASPSNEPILQKRILDSDPEKKDGADEMDSIQSPASLRSYGVAVVVSAVAIGEALSLFI